MKTQDMGYLALKAQTEAKVGKPAAAALVNMPVDCGGEVYVQRSGWGN
jgi:hypothetical protein